MVLAAPEFVVTQLVQELDEVEIAPELQHRMFPTGWCGARKAPKRSRGMRWMLLSGRSIDNAFAPEVELVGLMRWRLVGPLGCCCVGKSVVRCFSSSPSISSPAACRL